ncbi:MAG TPA: GAF domain-containing protein [Thermomicrobiales bacterium]|nr:GAF domain-containing protein [Thermomicrobiales bacterium]
MVPTRDQPSSDERTIALARLVFDLTQRFNGFDEFEDICAAVSDGLATMVDYDRLAIVLFRGEGRDFEMRYSRGAAMEFLSGRPSELARQERLFDLVDPALFDITETPRFAGDVDRFAHGYRQAAVAPVVLDRENVGLFTLMSKTERKWNDSDLWILSSLAGALGIILAGTSYRHEAEQRLREAEFIAELGLLLSFNCQLDALLDGAVEKISTAFAAPVSLYLVQQDRATLRSASRLGFDDGRISRVLAQGIVDFERNPVASALTRGIDGGVLVSSTDADESLEMNEVLADELRQHEVRRVLTGPIAWGGRVLGALMIFQLPDPADGSVVIPPPRQQQMALRVVQSLGPAIQNVLLQDDLTRALNESEVLRRLLSDTANRDDSGEALEIVVRAAQLLYAADFVAIGRSEGDETHWLRMVGSRVPFDGERENRTPPPVADAMERLAPILVRDYPIDPPMEPDSYPIHEVEGLRSSLAMPFAVEEQVKGVLMIGFRRPHFFDAPDIRFARSLAHGVAASLLRHHG